MDQQARIIVTGAAGFIGSCLVSFLNQKGFEQLIVVDQFDDRQKDPNLEGKKFAHKIERDELFTWLAAQSKPVDFVFHLGARTDTTEFDYSIHEKLNVLYSRKMWEYCSLHKVPLVYASSAATYGGGELGYKDDHEIVDRLEPLNPYGVSKNEFDRWALRQEVTPPFWAGLKFFNVYGPNEYHKARMASVIFHSFQQIREKGNVRLFRSHRAEYRDGEQLRDFVYVADVVSVCNWLMEQWQTADGRSPVASGLYNLGTGKARSFKDLVLAIFSALELNPQIEFIDTPLDIRDKYQYFTEADMSKLKTAGYLHPFYSLEEGVKDYVLNYLVTHRYY